MPEVAPRKSLLVRLLAIVILVAVCSIGATAWLAVQSTTRAIEQAQSKVLINDSAIYVKLIGYAAAHRTWAGAADTAQPLAEASSRRITLTTEDHQPIYGPATARSNPSTVIDPLSVDPALVPGTDESQISPEIVGPYKLPGAERARLVLLANIQAECMRELGISAKVGEAPDGRPTVLRSTPTSEMVREVTGKCDLPRLAAPTPTERRALTKLAALVNRCLNAQGLTGIKINRDFSWQPKDVAAEAGAQPIWQSSQVQTCLDAGRRTQLRPYVAPPALLYVGNPPSDDTKFDLSPANRTRIVTVTGLILLLSTVVTVLLATRLTRPLRALTKAVQDDVRAPVTTNDEIGYLAAAFNDLSTRREHTEGQRRAMVSDIAHELRTPLTNIRGWLELAQDGIVTPDPELMSSLMEEAVLLQHIINDLQDLAAADAGTFTLHPEPVNLPDLLHQVAAAHQAGAEAAKITLTTSTGPGSTLTADPVRLRQAIGNLVSNAIRHTPPGGRVTISTHGTTVEVTDTGTGIAPEDLPHIFDRFWRAERSRSRQTGGSGLGLAIARQLVQAHDGTLTADSSPGQGSRFTMTLPCHAAASTANSIPRR